MQELPNSVYSVSDLTAYIRAVLESNENLADIWVAGEISNLSQPKSGHVYFTLKDINATLRCVIWREQAWRLKGALRDGMAVDAHGSISVYEQGGQYQLYVDNLRAAGEGLLYQEFLRLKAALEEEGLFAAERKRELPSLPGVIGIVTSPSGAALQDMLNTLRARCPLIEAVVAPAAVQGAEAPRQIEGAIHLLNHKILPNVIIVARGGGSLEDLWAFNDERVVRAVASSAIPIVSGVGHETDFTLTDFAADVRAPTPTAAAVAVVPDVQELFSALMVFEQRMRQSLSAYLEERSADLIHYSYRLERQSPQRNIRQAMQFQDQLSQRLSLQATHYFTQQRTLLTALQQRLQGLDVHRILQRGFALIKDLQGTILTAAKQVKLRQAITVQMKDGELQAHVNEIALDTKKFGKNNDKSS